MNTLFAVVGIAIALALVGAVVTESIVLQQAQAVKGPKSKPAHSPCDNSHVAENNPHCAI